MAKKMQPLTEAEKKWIAKVEKVLAECPSKRFSAFTIGDNNITLYDSSFDDEVDAMNTDTGRAVHQLGCALGNVFFPFNIQSTAG